MNLDPTFHAPTLDPVEEYVADLFRALLAATCEKATGFATRMGAVTVQRQPSDGATLSVVVSIGPDIVAAVREELSR